LQDVVTYCKSLPRDCPAKDVTKIGKKVHPRAASPFLPLAVDIDVVFMPFPDPTDKEIVGGITFVGESCSECHMDGSLISRHDVRFESMKVADSTAILKDCSESFTHISAMNMVVRERVADKSRMEGIRHYLTAAHLAKDLVTAVVGEVKVKSIEGFHLFDLRTQKLLH